MTLRRRAVSLALGGLGLILAGVSIGILLRDTLSGQALRSTDPSALPASVDFEAPSLTLRDLGGTPHSLSDYAGKVVLVNLWATWCPPCEAEMPIYQRFYEKHRLEGFVVVAINDGESAAQVEAFVSKHGLSFPVWLDPTYEATDRAFKTGNLPTSYVINRGGRVRLVWIGAINEPTLERSMASLIKE